MRPRSNPVPIEQLAKQPPPDVGLMLEAADEIAHLALALTQERAHRTGQILSLNESVPYPEREPMSRARMREGVLRVLQAMRMLGYLE